MERSLEGLSGEETYLVEIEQLKQVIEDDESRYKTMKTQTKKEINNYKEQIQDLMGEIRKKDILITSLNRIKQDQAEKLVDLKDIKREKPCKEGGKELKEILQRNLSDFKGNSRREQVISTEELVNRHLKKRDNMFLSPKNKGF